MAKEKKKEKVIEDYDGKLPKTIYCMKDKEQVKPKKLRVVKTANGRKMAKGECPDCGTTVVQFVA